MPPSVSNADDEQIPDGVPSIAELNGALKQRRR
jgi:hypothetical protein